MGERPKPSLRHSFITQNDEIFNMVKDGYLKIDTIQCFNKNKKTYFYPKESFTIRKSVYNSYSNSHLLVHWERIKNLLENDDLFDQFVQILIDVFDENIIKDTFENVINQVRENYLNDIRIISFCNVLLKKKKTSLVNYINTGKGAFNQDQRTLITTNFGIDNITRLSGEIIIPVNDSDLEKIRKNKGFANLLDGGFVWINKVVDEDNMYESTLEKFKLISELSTETKKTKKL